MNSRRSILKLIGMAPAAAGSAASQLAPMLSSPAIAAAAAMTVAGGEAMMPQPSYGLLGPTIGKQVQKLMRAHEDEMWARRNVRTSGLDGDIASMRSTSRSWKERRQFERDAADAGIIRHANSVMWGN